MLFKYFKCEFICIIKLVLNHYYFCFYFRFIWVVILLLLLLLNFWLVCWRVLLIKYMSTSCVLFAFPDFYVSLKNAEPTPFEFNIDSNWIVEKHLVMVFIHLNRGDKVIDAFFPGIGNKYVNHIRCVW